MLILIDGTNLVLRYTEILLMFARKALIMGLANNLKDLISHLLTPTKLVEESITLPVLPTESSYILMILSTFDHELVCHEEDYRVELNI